MAYFPSYDMGCIGNNAHVQKFFYCCVLVAMVMFLPTKDKGIHVYTQRLMGEGFMK
jgi:hypothetical protein